MKCPLCDLSYKLTWNEYFKDFLGYHTCPECKNRFRLRYSVSYIILAFFSVMIADIPPLGLMADCLSIIL